MERNVGDTDRLARIVLGAVLGLASLAILGDALGGVPAILSPVLGVVALVLLVTGATSTCGLYSLLGVNTAR
jgi:hypothetical protein